jgi:hypothetical protein
MSLLSRLLCALLGHVREWQHSMHFNPDDERTYVPGHWSNCKRCGRPWDR